ncbi:uncharacterized protein LOC118268668 [Spodoptera frugiperda]|uniref:Uncharacterized protein LOC118268668 n=1 Tax=Spodoptera frugiperda TaxID=7108 RepID=A0A9R0D3P7_SPOFR|nr:uncharacterized protein LOC118268668 [Spodoptera frugiperda]
MFWFLTFNFDVFQKLKLSLRLTFHNINSKVYSFIVEMRTSTSQFSKMVSFMEEHGDLNKPPHDARGRILNMKSWVRLTEMLNNDVSGDIKTTDKWKKVWSDFKNNTKKKAARLHRAATGTGAGPVVYAKLTNLEKRVLKLIGVNSWIIAHRKVIRPVQVQPVQVQPVQMQPVQVQSVQVQPVQIQPVQTVETDQTTRPFIIINETPKEVKMEKNIETPQEENKDFKSEEFRIRKMELENQREWQRLASRALDILDKVVDKYCSS